MGIDRTVEQLGSLSNRMLQLDSGDFALKAITQREHLRSVGDQAPFLERVLRDAFQLPDLTLGQFGGVIASRQTPKLMIAATDVLAEQPYWFPDTGRLSDALTASSAIPGIFPWLQLDGLYLVDGGVIKNERLTNLAERGCGRIYACVVGGTLANLVPHRTCLTICCAVST